MPEPLHPRLRHIYMLRVGAVAVLALVVLAGCGSAEKGSGDAARSEPTASTSTKVCVQDTKSLGQADLDGDGAQETLAVLTRGGVGCPDTLGVAGPAGQAFTGAELATGEPPVGSGFGVAVPGREGELFVTRQDHPRGGFQLRVYAAGDGKLVELQVDGQALVPFIALDVQEHPLSIDCADGGVVVTEAVAHEPPGVAFAWDVKQTTYTLEGTSVIAGPAEELADNVLPGELKAKYPDVVKHTAFESCRSDG